MRMAAIAEEAGSLIPLPGIPREMANERPFRRPDIAVEWKLLKKAWSLHRRGKEKLSGRQLAEASARYYASDPLNDIQDWLWRFMLFSCQPAYEPKFQAAFGSIRPLLDLDKFADFKRIYDGDLSIERGNRYFGIMRDYFLAFSDFGQVHFLVVKGIGVDGGQTASSVNFAMTRMFYGNAFETFSASVDVLAYLNNLSSGRDFDKFKILTRRKYLELDKSSRFDAFDMNASFIALCDERDNQLRNASHHGAFQFDQDTQLITYQSGKGGVGAIQTIGYAAYLEKCTKLFLQIMTLLRCEIMLCHLCRMRPPL